METIFNRDFYPTPDNVIAQMLQNSDITGKVILEPSAGKGNIVDYLQRNGAKEVIACEKVPDLQRILATKCEVISDDFLKVTAEQVSHIDMIVMNPPFSADEDHILHAYEIAPAGCEIIALCNSSTLKSSFYDKRERLRELIQLHGSDECFGDVFSDAERKTNVSVSCVRLFKDGEKENEFEGYFSMDEDDFEVEGDGIIRYDFVRDLVQRYVNAVSMYDDVMEQNNKINELTSTFSDYGIKFGAYNSSSSNHFTKINRDIFKKKLQKDAWNYLFGKMNMHKYVTSKVRENINAFIEQQVNVPFTMKNIYRMVQMIIGTHAERMDKCLVEAFDLICSFSAENSTAGEKWKTNSDYMINKRFIVPYICDYDTRWSSFCTYVKTSYSGYAGKIEDIIKALCYLTGKNYDEQISLDDFCREFEINWGSWIPMGHYKRFNDGRQPEYIAGFFRIKGHKKGTMHFEFLDEKVWEMFNRKVAEIKGWRLPKTRTNKQAKKQTEVVLF